MIQEHKIRCTCGAVVKVEVCDRRGALQSKSNAGRIRKAADDLGHHATNEQVQRRVGKVMYGHDRKEQLLPLAYIATVRAKFNCRPAKRLPIEAFAWM